MKILFITQEVPFPPDTGSRNVIYHWLLAMSADHAVDVLVTESSEAQPYTLPGLPQVRVRTMGVRQGRTIGQRALRLLNSVRRGIPAASLVGMTSTAEDYVRKILATGIYDVMVLSANSCAGFANFPRKRTRVILFKHSVHAVDAREERRRSGAFNPRWLLEEWIVRRFEANTCRAADIVCTVNVEDAEELTRRYCLAMPVQVIPIGVDLSTFLPRKKDPGKRVIGFFGNLSWGANADAVRWFVNKILPKITLQFPDARFRVIGPGGEGLRQAVHDPRVVFTGRVPSIPEALEDVAIGVVPVISGTGVRFKLLEMLSMGIPTVTTSLGKLGTRCLHGEHVLVADDPESFAKAVTSLLSDAALRQRLSQNAPELAREFSWEVIFERIRALINSTVESRGTVAPKALAAEVGK